jgi:hypothetical protein
VSKRVPQHVLEGDELHPDSDIVAVDEVVHLPVFSQMVQYHKTPLNSNVVRICRRRILSTVLAPCPDKSTNRFS